MKLGAYAGAPCPRSSYSCTVGARFQMWPRNSATGAGQNRETWRVPPRGWGVARAADRASRAMRMAEPASRTGSGVGACDRREPDERADRWLVLMEVPRDVIDEGSRDAQPERHLIAVADGRVVAHQIEGLLGGVA
jgi:hypothetical protein